MTVHNTPSHPSLLVDEYMNKMQSTYTEESYSSTERKEALTDATVLSTLGNTGF